MLSNKLTFSLSFIVMLVFGLAFMATPAFAVPSYDATWDDPDQTPDGWVINLYFPITDDPVDAGTARPADERLTGYADDAFQGAADLELSAGTVTSTTINSSALDKDGEVTTTEGSVVEFRYQITVTPPADPAGLADEQDDTEITLTLDDYTPITLGLKHRTAGVKKTPFVVPVEGVNTFSFTLTKPENADDGFALIVRSVTPDPILVGIADAIEIENVYANGIRTGPSYVDDTVTTIAAHNLPDLDTFFRQGGTIKLLNDAGNDPAVVGGEAFITEIMWGVDGGNLTGRPSTMRQWIEVYYQGDEDSVDLQLQFTFGTHDPTGLDAVGNLYLAKWDPPGQSGHSLYGQFNGEPPVSLVSMYRKRSITVGAAGTSSYTPDTKFAETADQLGYLPGAWAKSEASVNMSGPFVGTPGSAHILPHVGGGNIDYAKNEIPGTPLQFSEVRNDDSVDNVDWIEIRNVSAAPVNLKDYEISLVTGVSRTNLTGRHDAQGRVNRRWPLLDADKKEVLEDPTDMNSSYEHELAIVGEDKYYDQVNNDVKRFPDWMLPAGAYLLIVNRDPEYTILAGGKDIEILANAAIDNKTTNKGSGVYYFVTPNLRFSNTGGGTPLLVMRSRLDRNEYQGKVHGDKSASIIDLAGGGRHDDTSALFNTEVWPLRGWKDPGGSPNIGTAGPNSVWNFVKDKDHEWWKTDGVKNNRVGYDKGTNPSLAVGSPGYPNDVVKDKTTDYKGTPATTDDVVLLNGNISISEIMFDASVHAGNERWNLVQWIELYNSSMTEAINLSGWELEIRNSDDHVDSFVDSSFIFKNLPQSIIHPNQTLLLVSARASSGGIAERQIYNLYIEHARELGLANRRANLLSPAGFYLRLSYKANDGNNTKIVVDEAGNVSVNGRQRSTTTWEAIPPSEGSVRRSLVRQYGTRAEDGDGPDLPAVGTLEDGWIVADLDGEGATYFGQRGDIATPGFRTGGPLPVSLASFRPVRNDTGTVIIKWITASELNNAGFNILRSQQRKGEFKVINPKMIAGAGTTSERNIYTFTDTTANPNVVYYYQIEDVSFDGRHQTLTTQRLKGHVSAGGKLTTTWSDLKQNR